MADFFDFEKASGRVAPRLGLPRSDEAKFNSGEEMDKSIMLYNHLLESIRSSTVNKPGLIDMLCCVKDQNNRHIKTEDAEFFVESLTNADIFKQVGDLYWSFCVIHYRIMNELTLLESLDHVRFDDVGHLKGVRNIYGRADKDGEELLAVVAATLTIKYFYEHLEDYKVTLQLAKNNSRIEESIQEHMGAWGNILLAYLSIVLFGGGIMNYNKFIAFCKDYKITPDTRAEDIADAADDAFGLR